MRRYESYKDSGVEWLGEVPSHWELGRISTYFTERRTKVSDKDYPALSVTKLGVFPQWENVAKTNDGDNRKLAKKGDFVINSRSDRKGSSGIAKQDGSVSLINIVLQPKKINSVYSEYLFKSYSFIEEFYRVGHGIVADLWTTRFEDIKNSLIIFPTLSEQQKIAQFLDDVQRSKFIFKKIERKVNEEDQIVTCFRDGQVTLRANRRTEGFTNALKEHGYQGIRKGDLVIHAMDAFAGAIGISDSDGKATPVYSVCLPRDKQKIDVYFYAYYLRNLALSGFISSLAKGIRERSTDFRYADFAELLLPIPPYLEQQKIADYLDKQTAKIDQAIALKTAHIEKLKEYKSVLINDVVTGKVRVSV